MRRRTFLRGTAAALATVPFGACGRASSDADAPAAESAAATTGGQGRAPAGRAIGLQLYTVRDQLHTDFEGTLARVAAIGYREVEFAGYFDRTPDAVRQAVADAGLTSPSTHVTLEALEQAWQDVLDTAARIGHRYVVLPSVPDEERTPEGYSRLAELFNIAGEEARLAGMQFAFHNHETEFTPIGGIVPYDFLLDNTDPELVQFQMDLFWAARGGADPVSYFERWPGRFPSVHVKDMDASGEMADVGSGTLNFRALFANAPLAGIAHYFVEHDEPAEPFESVERSYVAMVRLLR